MQRFSSESCQIPRHTAIWHAAAIMLLGAWLACPGCGKPPETTAGASARTPVSAPENVAQSATDAKADLSTPTSGLPRLLDLGAGKCIPCKMMAPILDQLKEEYAGSLEVVFIDVWENSEAGKEYGIEMIPTQIFYDAAGKELFRHEGFISKEDILAKWKELGVELPVKSS